MGPDGTLVLECIPQPAPVYITIALCKKPGSRIMSADVALVQFGCMSKSFATLMILKEWRRMHCCIRNSKSKGSDPGSLNGKPWKGQGCSTMTSKTIPEGNKPFRKEFHGPGHRQAWKPATPGGGHGPEARGQKC